MQHIVATVFGLGLVINAALFVPQLIAIWRSKSAEGVSLLTFGGFTLMQAVGTLHGWLQHDWSLLIGMGTSFLACGAVTALALIHRRPRASAR